MNQYKSLTYPQVPFCVTHPTHIAKSLKSEILYITQVSSSSYELFRWNTDSKNIANILKIELSSTHLQKAVWLAFYTSSLPAKRNKQKKSTLSTGVSKESVSQNILSKCSGYNPKSSKIPRHRRVWPRTKKIWSIIKGKDNQHKTILRWHKWNYHTKALKRLL